MLNQSIDYWVPDKEQEQSQIEVGYKTVTTEKEIYSLTFTTTDKDNDYYILHETINIQNNMIKCGMVEFLAYEAHSYSSLEEFYNNINSFYDNVPAQIKVIAQDGRFQILDATNNIAPKFSIIYIDNGDNLYRVCKTTESGQHTLVIKEKGQEIIETTEQFGKAVNSVVKPQIRYINVTESASTSGVTTFGDITFKQLKKYVENQDIIILKKHNDQKVEMYYLCDITTSDSEVILQFEYNGYSFIIFDYPINENDFEKIKTNSIQHFSQNDN